MLVHSCAAKSKGSRGDEGIYSFFVVLQIPYLSHNLDAPLYIELVVFVSRIDKV